MTEQDYTTIRNVTEKSRENKFVKERKRLLEKFTKLVEHTESKEKNKHARDGAKKLCNEVYDLTQAGIDDDVKAYLRLGPDFSATPKSLPYEKIIIETEKCAR